jgi:hypothetical protein
MPLKIKSRIDLKAIDDVRRKLDDLTKPMNQSESRALGEAVVVEMKSIISRGYSPILNRGKFPAYKNPKTGYPSTVRHAYPDKKNTPVNLKLSGDFLDALKSKPEKVGQLWRSTVGYFITKEALKEEGHRKGQNSQPKRPTLPKGDERFAHRIQAVILKFAQESVRRIIKAKS